MAPLAEIALSLVAFIGHFSIAVWLFNRLHAVALPRPLIKWLEKALLLAAAAGVFGVIARWALTGRGVFVLDSARSVGDLLWAAYGSCCCLAAAAAVPLW